MRAYADTSFLVKLIARESGTESAVAEYRRLGRPGLFLLSLHQFEVSNAIRQRVFHQRHAISSGERSLIKTERNAALERFKTLIERRALIEVAEDIETGLELARKLSETHTERLGCRGFDLLHVALALRLESEVFFTCDRIQGSLARATGLKVVLTGDE